MKWGQYWRFSSDLGMIDIFQCFRDEIGDFSMIVAQVKFNEFDFFFFELNNAHDQKIQL